MCHTYYNLEKTVDCKIFNVRNNIELAFRDSFRLIKAFYLVTVIAGICFEKILKFYCLL